MDNNSSSPDLSKIISLIMENPEIIEKISAIIKNDSTPTEPTVIAEESAAVSAEPAAVPTYTVPAAGSGKEKRANLLGALKPYVKESRAKAIDSMIAISNILEMMRSR